MKTRITLTFVSALLFATAGPALAQGDMPAPTPLPAQCPAVGEAMKMPGMEEVAGMDAAHKDFAMAMMKMEPSMMAGLKAEDPDVAFACGMIAHHQGAIDMAKAELAHGDNEEAKKKAQMIIDAQTKEIEDFTAWLAANAK
ncbi:MAG: DUF305 domain-containing protein [Parvibaculaceae bacterium]